MNTKTHLNGATCKSLFWGVVTPLLAVSILAFSGCNPQPPSVVYQIKQNGTPGGKCHVVSGPNQGKSGTYDSDGDCCSEGSGGWGCTECKTGGTDNGKCADGVKSVISGGNSIVLDGFYQLDDGRIVHGLTVLPTGAQADLKTIAFPVVVEKISDLRRSNDALEKAIADSVDATLRDSTAKTK